MRYRSRRCRSGGSRDQSVSLDGHRRGPYRSRRGLVMGVCRGLADYLDFPVFWIRLLLVLLMIFSAFWVVIALYFLAAVVMKPEPVLPLDNEEEQEFYDSYAGSSRKPALARLKRKFDSLDRRLQRMEHVVTSRDFDWDQRFNNH